MSEQLLKEILGEIKGIKTDVNELKTGMAGLKTEVNELKTDVNELKTGMAGLKTEVNELKTEVNELKTEVNGLKTEMAGMKTEIREVNRRQDRLESRLENEVIDKIRALFDARQVYEDRFTNVDDKLDLINTKLNRFDLNYSRMNLKLDVTAGKQSHQAEMLDILSKRSISQEAEIQLLKQAK